MNELKRRDFLKLAGLSIFCPKKLMAESKSIQGHRVTVHFSNGRKVRAREFNGKGQAIPIYNHGLAGPWSYAYVNLLFTWPPIFTKSS